MHLERIEGDDVRYVQGLARFPYLPESDRWWDSFHRRIAAADGLAECASAFRLTLGEDGSVERLFAATVDARSEDLLRRFLGGLAWLEGLADDSVATPMDASQFQGWATDFPPWRCTIMPPALAAGETWLACDARVFNALSQLLAEASTLGFGFSYQVHFRPFAPTAEQVRAVGRNRLRLAAAAGTPPALLAREEAIEAKFREARFLVEVIVGAPTEEAARRPRKRRAGFPPRSPAPSRRNSTAAGSSNRPSRSTAKPRPMSD